MNEAVASHGNVVAIVVVVVAVALVEMIRNVANQYDVIP